MTKTINSFLIQKYLPDLKIFFVNEYRSTQNMHVHKYLSLLKSAMFLKQLSRELKNYLWFV